MMENTVVAFQGLTKNMGDKPEFWQALLAADNPFHMLDGNRSRSGSVSSNLSNRAESSLSLISEVEESAESDLHSTSGSQLTGRLFL